MGTYLVDEFYPQPDGGMVHSENTELFLGELGSETMVYSLENFFAQTLGQIAVPGFFMISMAYLFL